MRAFVLSTRRQMLFATGVAAAGLWLGVTTAATLVGLVAPSKNEQEARTEARYERWIADRDARLSSAIAQLDATGGTLQDLAAGVEKRHAALALLLTDLKGAPGVAKTLLPAIAPASQLEQGSPAQRIEAVERDQDRMIDATETYAHNRADRLKLAFRLAGLDPAAYAGASDGLGGPLIEGKDPRALAAVLDVDEDFAGRLQHAVADLSDMQGLQASEQSLPLGRPTGVAVRESSGFGVRIDPFTGQPAYHPGQDFAGAYGSPVYVTAPGVVSFAGVRNGYGNTIEVDHGHGFKTRYGHLSSISVSVGQQVAVGQRIGAMGSTGRSTGPHLHYETWNDGRPQDPLRFIKAGDYVQQIKY